MKREAAPAPLPIKNNPFNFGFLWSETLHEIYETAETWLGVGAAAASHPLPHQPCVGGAAQLETPIRESTIPCQAQNSEHP